MGTKWELRLPTGESVNLFVIEQATLLIKIMNVEKKTQIPFNYTFLNEFINFILFKFYSIFE